MYVVYIAAGIGSGKSSAARMLEDRGALRIDLDQLSHDLLVPPSQLIDQLKESFGPDIINPKTGELKRDVLAQRAFASPEATATLEAIEHPAILAELKRRLDEAAGKPHPPTLCVVEVPLLDHMGVARMWADEIVTVTCPIELRRLRVQKRGMSAEDFDRRLAQQLPESWYIEQATTVFDNSGDETYLEQQIDAWWRMCEAHGWRYPDAALQLTQVEARIQADDEEDDEDGIR